MNEDKSTRYRRAQRTVFWIWLAVAAAATLILLPGGGAIGLRDGIVATFGRSSTSLLTVISFAALLVLLREIVGLPIALYKSVLERRYGVPHLSLRRQIVQDVEGLPVGVIVVAAHAAVVYFYLDRWPHWWWLIAAATVAGGVALLAAVAPVVTPLFYTCTPLRRSALRARLQSLASRAGVEGLDVYEWATDPGGRRASAALVGIGRGRRVLLGDALLSDYSDDEIEVIVAHELGHHVHHDILWGILVRSLLLVVGFAAAATALDLFWHPMGLDAPNDAAGMPLMLLAGGLVLALTQPLQHALSRMKEYRADRFALALTGRADVFVTALRRLAAQNLAEPRPSPATLWLFHSHPPIEQRIQAARAFLS